ncbi:hypothetical protein CIPAW_04G042500 [Carya illinoinensis]|uniref:Secreted protein n=1 Tax=Carya illinoinensis TaxID=32201 RepID=A0A8T1QR59_CARIL|nr:hypothetical protein CIPAW_04G042500 [Carya illinoinensis]
MACKIGLWIVALCVLYIPDCYSRSTSLSHRHPTANSISKMHMQMLIIEQWQNIHPYKLYTSVARNKTNV